MAKDFGGLRVLSLESRRYREIAQLIENRGGQARVAPSVREAPIGASDELRDFVHTLLANRIDAAIFSTGSGTRALADAAKDYCDVGEFLAALRRVAVIARSGKPAAVLRELQIPIALTAPEPNTSREVLQVIDENPGVLSLKGRRVAVQEHGGRSEDLHVGLVERGATVVPVQVYRWTLPEDTGPLREAVSALVRGGIDVVLITSAVQLQHLLVTAESMRLRDKAVDALGRTVIGSIGPVASAELRRQGVEPDVEPSHPKMGFLVNEVAERAHELLARKKSSVR